MRWYLMALMAWAIVLAIVVLTACQDTRRPPLGVPDDCTIVGKEHCQ